MLLDFYLIFWLPLTYTNMTSSTDTGIHTVYLWIKAILPQRSSAFLLINIWQWFWWSFSMTKIQTWIERLSRGFTDFAKSRCVSVLCQLVTCRMYLHSSCWSVRGKLMSYRYSLAVCSEKLLLSQWTVDTGTCRRL